MAAACAPRGPRLDRIGGDRDPEAERRLADGSAWRDFCRALERAGEACCARRRRPSAFDRAEGFRYLTRLLRAGLESQLEFADPRFPGFFQLSNETIKIGNDNPDNVYRNANVSRPLPLPDPRHARRRALPLASAPRAAATRATARCCRPASSTATSSTSAPTARSRSSSARAREGQLAADAADHHAADRARDVQRPQRAASPRGCDRAARARPRTTRSTPRCSRQRLLRAVAFVSGTANLFVDWMARYAAHPNALPSDDQEICQRAGGDANIHYCQSRWQLGPRRGARDRDRPPSRSAARGTSSSATSGWSRSTTATTAST